jgi:hypothetical protein
MTASGYVGAVGVGGQRRGVRPSIGLKEFLTGTAGGKENNESKRVGIFHAGRKARLASLNADTGQ